MSRRVSFPCDAFRGSVLTQHHKAAEPAAELAAEEEEGAKDDAVGDRAKDDAVGCGTKAFLAAFLHH